MYFVFQPQGIPVGGAYKHNDNSMPWSQPQAHPEPRALLSVEDVFYSIPTEVGAGRTGKGMAGRQGAGEHPEQENRVTRRACRVYAGTRLCAGAAEDCGLMAASLNLQQGHGWPECTSGAKSARGKGKAELRLLTRSEEQLDVKETGE